MHLDVDAIVLAALPHGEHGAVVRFLTAERGMVAGYVAGGRSRRTRPLLAAGNSVRLRLDARGDRQLGRASVEAGRSRIGIADDPLALAVTEWLTGLAALILPEGHPYPRLFDTLGSVLDLAEMQRDPATTLAALVRFELLMLAELGFGLDLSSCAATGSTANLAFVSPKSGRAVSEAAGRPYASRLFGFPRFLADGSAVTPAALGEALRMTRHFIARDLLCEPRGAGVLAARDRIEARLQRL
jgi:DNA repair protein RecO (recombination protein O)